MADADDDLTLRPSDAGLLFRLEMWLTHTVLGYWRHLAFAAAFLMLSVAVFGQYRSWVRRDQRGTHAALASAVEPLGMPILALADGVARQAADLPDVAARKATADAVHAVAVEARDPARRAGLLQAAELYRLAGDTEGRRKSLEAASGGDGVMGFAVEAALATLELEEGKADTALGRLTKLAGSEDPFLGQQASIDLGLAYEQAGRKDEARATYDTFVTKWPDSPLIESVRERLARVRTE